MLYVGVSVTDYIYSGSDHVAFLYSFIFSVQIYLFMHMSYCLSLYLLVLVVFIDPQRVNEVCSISRNTIMQLLLVYPPENTNIDRGEAVRFSFVVYFHFMHCIQINEYV